MDEIKQQLFALKSELYKIQESVNSIISKVETKGFVSFSNLIREVVYQRRKFIKDTGVEPDTVYLGGEVFNVVKKHLNNDTFATSSNLLGLKIRIVQDPLYIKVA